MRRYPIGIRLGWLGAVVLIAQAALAFRPGEREPLPNFDKRPAPAVQAPAAPAGVFQAGLKVEPGDNGRQRLITARRGFLTGPGGSGAHVPAGAAAAIPATDPDRGLKAFLAAHRALAGHGPEALAGARKNRDATGPRTGMRSVVFQQEVDGVPVLDALLIAHTTRRGELLSVSSAFLADPEAAAEPGSRAALAAGPAVSAAQAVVAAAASLGVTLARSQVEAAGAAAAGPERKQDFRAPGLSGQTRAALAWLPAEGGLRLCWDVILTSRVRGEMFRVLVDAETGEPWLRRALTFYATPASYRVYTSDSPSPFSPGHNTPLSTQPPLVARDLITWTAYSTNASPAGWIPDAGNTTIGNNVDAHLDANDDDLPDANSRPIGSPSRVFDIALDLGLAPAAYSKASIAQLFYLNNWIHDKLYDLGFTEAAGNFQTDNFGRGGLGGDAVQADAQDGGGTDNANFSSPPDGMEPRMQMYIFTGPSPDRDGSLDSEIVLHEYVHGLSNRHVGGGGGLYTLQSCGMGEGWSDFYPLALLSEPGDDPHAVYACGGYATYLFYDLTQNYYFGIRRYPYSTDMTKNPLTFKDIDPAQASSHPGVPMSPLGGGSADEVHNAGEVWCAALWDVRANLVDKHGYAIGNDLMLQLVTDGMALSPPNPNYLQARDAIIQADLVNTDGANFAELWAGFAKRGMGYNAWSPDSDYTDGLVESFTLPDDLVVQPTEGWSATGYQYGPFSPASSVYQLMNMGDASLNWTATSTAAWLSFSQTSGTLVPGDSLAVTVFLGVPALSLAPGSYAATVRFRNTTSGITQSMTVQLTVKEIPGRIEVLDSVAPEGDLALPFGLVAPGFARTESVTVWNRSGEHDLLVSGIGFGFYEEDFNDGLAQNWVPKTSMHWTVTNNEYKAYAKATGRFMESRYFGEKWADGTFQVRMRRTGYAYSSAILAMRASDDFSLTDSTGSAYLIGIANGGYYFVAKSVNGSVTMLQSWSSTPYLGNGVNLVECSIEGDSLTVSFNGHEVASGNDSSVTGPGRVALLGYSGDSTQTIHFFDEVSVTQPEAPAGISVMQRWYNERPSGSADLTQAPRDWVVPVYPGPDSDRGAQKSNLGTTINGTFRLDNVPVFPVRLAPHSSFTFNAAYLPVSLASNRNTLLVRSNDADTPEKSLSLTGCGASNWIEVLPAGLDFAGRPGGPFPAGSGTFTVTNRSAGEIAWTVSGAASWLTVEPASGTLPAFAAAAVTVTVNPSAASLGEGLHTSALLFRNEAIAGYPDRLVTLAIRQSPRVALNPVSFGLTNMPGGKVPMNLAIGNTGTSNLFWSLRLPHDELVDDVESAGGGWTHSGVNDRWHLSSLRSASGVQSWYCGVDATRQYVNNMTASLVSPPLQLGAFARLEYKHWYATEPSYDNAYVEISTNSGATYAILQSFTGSNLAWTAQSVDLSAYAGRTAFIRFRFRSDGLNSAFEGWFVDDLRVAPLAVGPGNVVTAGATTGLVPAGKGANVTVTFDAAGLAEGETATGGLALVCNDVDSPFTPLPYRMEIVPPLTLSAPARAAEGAGLLAGAGLLSQGVAPGADVTIRLTSSDPERVAVPETVILPAGATEVAFDLTIGDDRKLSGSRAVFLAAFSDRFGSATLIVDDNESTNLALYLPSNASEGLVYTNGGRLVIGGIRESDLMVTLESSDAAEWMVPATVTIPAGETSAVFTVTLPLDGVMDGSQTGTVRASAAGFGPALVPFVARDSDVHHYAFAAVPSPRYAGTPFAATLTARDTNGEPVLVRNETVALTAAGRSGATPLLPTNVTVVNGAWSGLLSIGLPDRAVIVTALSPAGFSGRSNPFDVLIGPLDHFAWGAVANPQNIGYAFKANLTARDAGGNVVTGFSGTATLTGFTGWEGDPGYRTVKILPSTTVTFTRGTWSGNVTIQAAASDMCLKAADKSGHSGYSQRFTAGPLSLGLKLPAAVWEHDGVLSKAATVTLSRAVATSVVVRLASSDKTELRVPVSVLVPAGKLSAAFNLTAVDDAVADTAQPVRVSASMAGYAAASAALEVRPAFVKKPVLTPAGGVFAGEKTVLIACATAGAQLRYTLDGSEVTELSPAAPASLVLTDSATLSVRGFKMGSIPSETASASFRKAPLEALANPAARANLAGAAGGLAAYRVDVPEFATNLTVAISGGWGDCDLILRYGEMPDTNAYDYCPALPGNAESVSVPNPRQGAWYVLLAAGPGGYGGVTLTSAYQVDIPPVEMPFITPAGGVKVGSIKVVMSCVTTGATIRYTLTGLDPTSDSAAYAAPFTLGATPLMTVKAQAFKAGRPDSAVVSVEYQIATLLKAVTPVTVSGALESLKYYAFKAPAGAKQLTFTLTGGTGNGNLYVSRGVFPTLAVFDAGSVIPGNSDLIMIGSPVIGNYYYVLVHGKAAYQNAVLKVVVP
jgi:hypothetical protein